MSSESTRPKGLPAPAYRGELSVVHPESSFEESGDLKALKVRLQSLGVQRWVSAFEESGYNPVEALIHTAMDPDTSPFLKANIDLKLASMLMPRMESENKNASPIVNVVVQSVSRVDLA